MISSEKELAKILVPILRGTNRLVVDVLVAVKMAEDMIAEKQRGKNYR